MSLAQRLCRLLMRPLTLTYVEMISSQAFTFAWLQVLRPLGTGAFHAAVEVHGRFGAQKNSVHTIVTKPPSSQSFTSRDLVLSLAGSGATGRQRGARVSLKIRRRSVNSTHTVRQGKGHVRVSWWTALRLFPQAIHMGYTDHGPFEVQMLIAEMAKRWPGRDACPSFVRLVLFRGPKGQPFDGRDGSTEEYDVLNKNCCHFSDELCQVLGVGQLPSWVPTSVCPKVLW